MGQPKMLLPWGDSTVLGHIISLWNQVGARQIAVVCPPAENAVVTELNRVKTGNLVRIVNPRPERGMFSSIQSAACWQSWDRQLTHWIIALGDQPQISRRAIERLLEAVREKPDHITQLARAGAQKHPVALPLAAFEQLRNSSSATLREFLETWSGQRQLCEFRDDSLDFDLDTPADYKALRARFDYL